MKAPQLPRKLPLALTEVNTTQKLQKNNGQLFGSYRKIVSVHLIFIFSHCKRHILTSNIGYRNVVSINKVSKIESGTMA